MKLFVALVLMTTVHQQLISQKTIWDFRSDVSSQDIFVQQQPLSGNPKKSAASAVLYSLLLPGLGEYYADGFDEGRYSLVAEAGLWLTYYSFRQYGTWIQTDARNFAVSHAGAQLSGKNDRYFVDVGNFNDTYEYNEKQLRDRELENVYDPAAGYFWKWDSDNHRKEYRAMRVSSERVLNNSKFVIATIVVNRLISAINAARLVRQYNRRAETDLGYWQIESSLLHDGIKPDGMMVHLIHRF